MFAHKITPFSLVSRICSQQTARCTQNIFLPFFNCFSTPSYSQITLSQFFKTLYLTILSQPTTSQSAATYLVVPHRRAPKSETKPAAMSLLRDETRHDPTQYHHPPPTPLHPISNHRRPSPPLHRRDLAASTVPQIT